VPDIGKEEVPDVKEERGAGKRWKEVPDMEGGAGTEGRC
jgi:hypothetical protein